MEPVLHHVGILVKSIPEAAERYVSRFGYTLKSEIVHDPVQTAHVQFLEGQAGTLLELIAADGPASKLTNALKKGGGLNHLCYLVDDIEADCAALRAQGMFLLCAPVAAEAFSGRRIAWLMGTDGIPIELVERGPGL